MTASTLSKLFLKWFQNTCPDARIYRNNAGCFKTQAGNWVRYGIPNKGGADFIAFVPEHYTGWKNWGDDEEIIPFTCQFYEIKTAKDKMSKDQIKFANMITEMGGDYFIVHETELTDFEKSILTIRECDKNKITKDFWIEKWTIN